MMITALSHALTLLCHRPFYASFQTVQTAREHYCIIGFRHTVRNIIKECLVCFKLRRKMGSQLMGKLPRLRVAQTTPFLVSGVDFFGSFQVRHHTFTTTYLLCRIIYLLRCEGSSSGIGSRCHYQNFH